MASFSISPANIPANHPGNITLTLTGVGTNWLQASTIFNLSGVLNVAKVSQNITGPTTATVVITTAGSTGSLTITEFEPTDVSGLVLFLESDIGVFTDAAMTTPATLQSDHILGWQDQSGAGNHATQSNAAKFPTLNLNQVNGLQSVHFDRSVSWLSLAGFNVTDHTIFIVASHTSGGSDQILLGDSGSAKYFADWDNTGTVFYYDGTNGPSSGANFPVSTWMELEINRSSTSVKFIKNGAQQGSTGTVLSLSTNVGNIGSRQNGSLLWGGDIALILVYNRVLTALEFFSVRSWIATKYNITMVTVPGPPTGVSAWNDGSGKIQVLWTAPAGTITSYNVYRSTTPGGEGGTPYKTGLAASPFIDFAATNGTAYYYQVSALNAIGEGVLSAEVTATASAFADAMPATLTAQWDANNAYKDAGMTTLATAANDTVSAFKDVTGNGYNAIVVGGATGTLNIDAHDSAKNVAFSNSLFAIANSLALSGDHTVFIVCTCSVQDSSQSILLGQSSTGHFFYTQLGKTTEYIPNGGTIVGFSNSDPMQIGVRQLLELNRSGALLHCVSNGIESTDSPAAVGTGSVPIAYLGADGSSVDPWRGSVNAIYIYNRFLNPAELSQARAYIQNHWGCPGLNSFIFAFGQGVQNFPSKAFAFCEFPSITSVAAGGYALASYNNNGGEGPVNSNNYFFKSTDGIDWHNNTAILNDPLRDSEIEPGMVQLPNGNLFQGAHAFASGQSPQRTQGYVFSTDNGATWSSLQSVSVPAGYNTLFFFGNPIAIASNNILAPAYGTNTTTGIYDSFLMKSTDGGSTWAFFAVIMAGTTSTLQFNETAVANLGGGNLVALARSGTSGGALYQATSADNGATWTSPVAQFAGLTIGVAPALVTLNSGSLFAFANSRSGLGGGIVGWKSTNGGTTWGAHIAAYAPPQTASNGYPSVTTPDGVTIVLAFGDDLHRILIRSFIESDFP